MKIYLADCPKCNKKLCVGTESNCKRYKESYAECYICSEEFSKKEFDLFSNITDILETTDKSIYRRWSVLRMGYHLMSDRLDKIHIKLCESCIWCLSFDNSQHAACTHSRARKNEKHKKYKVNTEKEYPHVWKFDVCRYRKGDV